MIKETFLLSDGQLEGIIRNLENSIDELRNVIDAGKCAGKPSKEGGSMNMKKYIADEDDPPLLPEKEVA